MNKTVLINHLRALFGKYNRTHQEDRASSVHIDSDDDHRLWSLDVQLMRMLCQQLDIEPTQAEVMFAELDDDHDGKISFEQLAEGFDRWHQEEPPKAAAAADDEEDGKSNSTLCFDQSLSSDDWQQMDRAEASMTTSASSNTSLLNDAKQLLRSASIDHVHPNFKFQLASTSAVIDKDEGRSNISSDAIATLLTTVHRLQQENVQLFHNWIQLGGGDPHRAKSTAESSCQTDDQHTGDGHTKQSGEDERKADDEEGDKLKEPETMTKKGNRNSKELCTLRNKFANEDGRMEKSSGSAGANGMESKCRGNSISEVIEQVKCQLDQLGARQHQLVVQQQSLQLVLGQRTHPPGGGETTRDEQFQSIGEHHQEVVDNIICILEQNANKADWLGPLTSTPEGTHTGNQTTCPPSLARVLQAARARRASLRLDAGGNESDDRKRTSRQSILAGRNCCNNNQAIPQSELVTCQAKTMQHDVQSWPRSGASSGQTFKVIFIGDHGVGKTSLIEQSLHGRMPTTTPNATVGIDFKVKTVEVAGSAYRVQLWDTAGQERYQSITQNYYRRVDALCLVYDVGDELSFLNVRRWISSIQETLSRPKPMLLVGNKADRLGEEDRLVQHKLGTHLAQSNDAVGFVLTSARTGHNVDLAIETILGAMIEDMQLRDDLQRQHSRPLTLTEPAKCSKTCCHT